MRKGHLLFSAVHFFVLIAILCVGFFFLCLEYIPGVRNEAITFFSSPHTRFKCIGFLLLGLGGSLFLGLYAMNRAQYLRIEMGKLSIALDEALVRKTIEQFWRVQLPHLTLPFDVYFSQQNIEIMTVMPEDEEKALEEIEKELSAFLARQLGYERSFFLTLTVN